jgi:Pectate lyase superfamily protein
VGVRHFAGTVFDFGGQPITNVGASTDDTGVARIADLDGISTGQTVSAQAHGVVADGTTDDTAAITAAIAASSPGDIVVFPRGAIRTTAPITLFEQRTYLFGWDGVWPSRYTSPYAATIKPKSTFTGAAAILIREKTLTSRTLDADGIRVIGLMLDVSAAPATTEGIKVEGLCRDLRFDRCMITNAKGHAWDFTLGAGTGSPRGIWMRDCGAYAASSSGFRMSGVTDSTFEHCASGSCTQHGWWVSSGGENVFTDCRSGFNAQSGFVFDGSSSLGLTTLVAPGTDRNGQNGIVVSMTGNQPLQILGPRLRRDGSSSTSSNYAALKISGSAGNTVVPVEVTAGQTVTGLNDGGTGTEGPQWGIYATYAQRLNILGGEWWGVSSGFKDGGNNTSVYDAGSARYWLGAHNAQAVDVPVGVSSVGAGDSVRPDELGWLGWAYDSGMVGGGTVVTAGVLQLIKVSLRRPATVGKVVVYVQAAGATLTSGQNFAGLYDMTGTQIDVTADQTTAWGTTGLKTTSLAGSHLLAAGDYYVALVANGTTTPAFGRQGNLNGTLYNGNLAAAVKRFGTQLTGQTSLPSTLTLSSTASGGVAYWAALST